MIATFVMEIGKKDKPIDQTVDGMSVGILGYGRIGQAIARKLEAFNCKISYHARSERKDSPHRYYDNLIHLADDVTALIVITRWSVYTSLGKRRCNSSTRV